MSEEIKTEEKVCKCNCDMFKKFALITAGAFTGCLLALCVFTTFAKPPVPAPTPIPAPINMQRPVPPMHGEFERPDHKYHHRIDRPDHIRHDKKLPHKNND